MVSLICWAARRRTAGGPPCGRPGRRARAGVGAGRQAEKAAAKEAERAKAAEAERRQLEKGLDGRVAALERSLPDTRAAAAQAVADEGTPPPDLRADARRYLQGRLQPAYELMAPETPLAARDGAANTWLAAQVAAAQVAQLVHEQIGLGELYSRVDAVEVECWAGFISRVRALAGE